MIVFSLYKILRKSFMSFENNIEKQSGGVEEQKSGLEEKLNSILEDIFTPITRGFGFAWQGRPEEKWKSIRKLVEERVRHLGSKLQHSPTAKAEKFFTSDQIYFEELTRKIIEVSIREIQGLLSYDDRNKPVSKEWYAKEALPKIMQRLREKDIDVKNPDIQPILDDVSGLFVNLNYHDLYAVDEVCDAVRARISS